MMNEFGVPINDAERNMLPPGADKPHDRMMAESGVEMNIGLSAFIAPAISIGASILGGSKSASAARSQANANNEATQRQFEYDTKKHEMDGEKLRADHQYTLEKIAASRRNEQRIALHKDATNLAQYNHDMQIRNYEQDSLNRQFAQSGKVYAQTVGMNQIQREAADNDAVRDLEESRIEALFDSQNIALERLTAEGKARARSGAGRTGRKAVQAAEVVPGLELAMLSASLTTDEINLNSVLQSNSRKQWAADIAAEAQRMLHPGTLPDPVIPFLTPIAEQLDPRALQDFDFGPEPVRGAVYSASAAANGAWGQALPGIASAATGLASGIAGNIASGGWTSSDIELKENISQVGVSPSGLNIYEWNYIGENNRYRGVIAQDLIAKGRQDAVTEADNGYLAVYYDKIDVNLQLV